MNFNFLTGKKDPYMGMTPGMADAKFAKFAGTDATNQMLAKAQMGGNMRDVVPSDKVFSKGLSMESLGAGLSELGGALAEQQPVTPAEFAPVPMPQQVAMPNLTPQLAQFDFADYLRKRQAGLL